MLEGQGLRGKAAGCRPPPRVLRFIFSRSGPEAGVRVRQEPGHRPRPALLAGDAGELVPPASICTAGA